MRWILGLSALCLLAVIVGPAAAQDAALGTPNLDSPNVLPNGDVRLQVDWRYWEGGNDTISGTIDYGITDRLQVTAAWVSFDNVGRPPIGSGRRTPAPYRPTAVGQSPATRALRASDLHGPGIKLTWVGKTVEPGSWGWAIAPGVEFLDMTGTNLAIGASAGDQETVFTAALPIGIPDGDALWIIEPKVAAFPDTEPTQVPVGSPWVVPPEIDSFGTVVGIGLGVVAPLGSTGDWWIHGDVTPIISGDNTINVDTNGLHTQLPWSAGVRWNAKLINDDSYVDVFLTNAAGPTTATSLIVAPDRSVSIGGKISVQW